MQNNGVGSLIKAEYKASSEPAGEVIALMMPESSVSVAVVNAEYNR